MLKNLRKQFWEFCPKYNGKIVKSGFYVSRISLWGNFFPEKTTHMFVLLRLRTKSFRTFIERFSTFFKTAGFVSTDKFYGKKFFSSVPDFEPKFSTSFPKKCEKNFKTASCVSRGNFWGKLFNVLENKRLYLIFFSVFLPKLIGKPAKTAFWVSRRSSSGEKGCLKRHKKIYLLCDLKRIIFGPSANFFR